MAVVEIPCKICEKGILTAQRIHRMSGPAVTIGYILLVPSILGILLCGALLVIFWVSAGAAAAATKTEPIPFVIQQPTAEALRATKVPADLVAHLEKGEPVDKATINALPPRQRTAAHLAVSEKQIHDRAQKSADNARVGAAGCLGGCGTIIGVGGMVLSFIGGLIGWLLVMKKNVLKCNTCGSVVAAS